MLWASLCRHLTNFPKCVYSSFARISSQWSSLESRWLLRRSICNTQAFWSAFVASRYKTHSRSAVLPGSRARRRWTLWRRFCTLCSFLLLGIIWNIGKDWKCLDQKLGMTLWLLFSYIKWSCLHETIQYIEKDLRCVIESGNKHTQIKERASILRAWGERNVEWVTIGDQRESAKVWNIMRNFFTRKQRRVVQTRKLNLGSRRSQQRGIWSRAAIPNSSSFGHHPLRSVCCWNQPAKAGFPD